MASLTAHVMVRNEPFIWYAVKAIYPFVDEILLWDTGSDDAHTLKDIARLRKDDPDGKIKFKRVKIAIDETKWTVDSWRKLNKASRKKYTKGNVRLDMIKATQTDWFMVVDGDEVHYPETMRKIRATIETAPKGTICYAIPLVWLNTTFTWFRRTSSGRVFRTAKTWMHVNSPNEMHTVKSTNKALSSGRPERSDLDVTPYAHFEKLLKPWRRPVDRASVQIYGKPLPPAMIKMPKFMERFFKERRASAATG